MADWFYKTVVTAGRLPFWVSSRPVVLNRWRVPPAGGFLLASNHLSPYDVPVLMRHTPRILDFVSIVELARRPVVGWMMRAIGAFPLDRGRVDVGTTKTIVDRLRAGRVVAMFPEGRLRAEGESVLVGGAFHPGVLRIAQVAGVPIVPVAVWKTGEYAKVRSWFPGAGVRYGVNFGAPIVGADEGTLAGAWRDLYRELMNELGN